MVKQIKWVNALSTQASLENALEELANVVKENLGSTTADLGILFVASAYASDYSRLMPLLLEKFNFRVLVGCGGGGIVGMENANRVQEIEMAPAISLSVANLPDVQITSFYLKGDDLPDLDSSPDDWVNLVGVKPDQNPQFILLADPMGARINDLLAGLDFAYPQSPKVGGLSSSGSMGIPNALFYFDRDQNMVKNLLTEGTIGIALTGAIKINPVVAQGCRPIGKPLSVTKAERNIILGVVEEDQEPQPPLFLLRELIQTLNDHDRELAQTSLFVGLVGDEFKFTLQPGDFLIRNLIGVDPAVGAIAIGDRVRPGQRIQFHLRDAQTSAEDLDSLLKEYTNQRENTDGVAGALMFSCLGRGEGLYGKPNFDSQMMQSYLGNIPVGGFFCNGEIGPVGSNTYLHGYTSSFAIIKSQ